MAILTILSDQPIAAHDELQRFVESSQNDGAVASFVGMVRPASSGGAGVSSLIVERHPRLTRRSLEDIAGDADRRFDVSNIRIVHRWGAMAPGDTIVFVAAAAAHRRDALRAVDYLIDRLKSDAVFWKREEGDEGCLWIEPTDEDRASAGRWD